MPQFGKYGITGANDVNLKQRSFQIWMAEVKGVQTMSAAVPKYEFLQINNQV